MNIFNHFQHITLTNDQKNALVKIQDFLTSDENVFILQGYAGSGKTTLLKGIVDYLQAIEQKYQLMAPTGRATKVLRELTKKEATTIHRGIYNFEKLESLGADNVNVEEQSFHYYFPIEYSDQTDQVFRSKLTNPSIGEKKSKFPVKKMGGSR